MAKRIQPEIKETSEMVMISDQKSKESNRSSRERNSIHPVIP